MDYPPKLDAVYCLFIKVLLPPSLLSSFPPFLLSSFPPFLLKNPLGSLKINVPPVGEVAIRKVGLVVLVGRGGGRTAAFTIPAFRF